MTGDEFASITRGLVKRGWNEIEPKVAYMAGGGTIANVLVLILSSYHVPITPDLKQWLGLGFGVLAGYLFPSSGQIVTIRTSPDQLTTTTKTVGAVQTVVTGAIPVQAPKQAPKQAPDVPLSALLKPSTPADEQSTAIYPPPVNLENNL